MRSDCLEKPGMRIEVMQSIIKRSIIKPLFFNFPTLDKYTLIFPSRRRAYAIMKEFEDLLYSLVKNRPRRFLNKEPVEPKDELLIHMMERALEQGKIDETQFRSNLKITFVTFLTAHEDTQQLLNSMFWRLGKDQVQNPNWHSQDSTDRSTFQRVQDKLRAKVVGKGTVIPTGEVLNSLPCMTSVICELLRVYPPVSQLINRVAVKTARLGGIIEIPKGTFVGWNATGVQSNEQVWGPTARQFIPERWGNTPDEIVAKLRRETVMGNFLAFNSHTRKYLGQGYALLQMKMVLFEVVRRIKWSVDPEYKMQLTSVSGMMRPSGFHADSLISFQRGILGPLMCRDNLQEFKSED